MSATINDYRDAVAVRIGQLTLPIPAAITSKPAPLITVESVATQAAITVNGAAQQFERINRGEARQLPTVMVGVHRKLPVDGNGGPDSTVFDQCVELVELLAKKLLGEFPDSPGVEVTGIEQPVLYLKEQLEQKGLFQSALLLSFSGTDFETVP